MPTAKKGAEAHGIESGVPEGVIVKGADVLVETPFTDSPEVVELKAKLAESNAENERISAEKAEMYFALNQPSSVVVEPTTSETATLSEPKVKLLTVKFLEAHSFSVGMRDVVALKGDKHEVDVHIANKLTSRKIAVIIN